MWTFFLNERIEAVLSGEGLAFRPAANLVGSFTKFLKKDSKNPLNSICGGGGGGSAREGYVKFGINFIFFMYAFSRYI